MTPTPAPFANSAEHVSAELAWLELVLQHRALDIASRRGKRDKFDEFAGLYVSEQEIVRYAEERVTRHETPPDHRTGTLLTRIESARDDVARRLTATVSAGSEPRLLRLSRRFGLSDAELRILICCLAPDWELRFQRYFAYLQNDVSRRRPTVQLLGELWFDRETGAFAVRASLAPDATLIRERLVTLGGHDEVPFPARQPVVAEAVVDYLAGEDRPDSLLAGFVTIRVPAARLPGRTYYHHHQDILDSLLTPLRSDGQVPTAYIWGPPGCGKGLVTNALAAAAGVRLMRADCRTSLATGALTREALRALRRDARLHGCLVELTRCEVLLGDSGGAARAALDEFLDDNQAAGIVLTGTASFDELSGALAVPLSGFEIPRPTVAERADLWRGEMAARSCGVDEEFVDRLAVGFRFTPLEICRALDAAAAGRQTFRLDADTLLRRCRETSRHAIHRFARKIVPRRSWDALILPADSRAQLDEICNAVRTRRRVYEDWGFEGTLALGAGLNVLFAGPSGVGKTMSAEIIAGDLGLDLFAVDLSCVVSKYIGETEKNLSKVFDEAEATNGVLFFDECDALFGKRTEVRDSHDRYANIEVNYLLQRIDRYEGVVILATNLKANLDPAFTRRLQYAIEFPFPEAEYRERIWRKVFPAMAPVDADVDFDFLARQFKLTGGHIKNIALNAAFLAAGNGGCVGMKQVILAARRELQKIGRTCSKSDFGRYYSWVRDEVGV